MYQATKIFISNLNTRLAQRFLAIVLLPRVRQEIKEKKKLHFELFQVHLAEHPFVLVSRSITRSGCLAMQHGNMLFYIIGRQSSPLAECVMQARYNDAQYIWHGCLIVLIFLAQALKKATYKAGAFYKGALLPLCQTRTCTLREAVIFTSVLKRTSIPVLHSAAALLRLAEMDYCGTTSFFIRVLLDKKYALPHKVRASLTAALIIPCAMNHLKHGWRHRSEWLAFSHPERGLAGST